MTEDLLQPIFAGKAETPIKAHIQALVSIYKLKPIGEDVSSAVCEFAEFNSNLLGRDIEHWNKLISAGRAIDRRELKLSELLYTMALSYGSPSNEGFETRCAYLKQALQDRLA